MPRAPLAEISTVPAVVAPSNTPREALAVGQEIARPLEIAVAQAEEMAVSQLFAEARGDFRRGLNNAQEQAETQDDPNSILSEFDSSTERILSDVREQLSGSPQASMRFEGEAALQIEARRSQVVNIQRIRIGDAALALMVEQEDEVIRAIDLAGTPEDQQREIEMFEAQIRDLPISEVAKARRIEALSERADTFRMNRLLEKNPQEALRIGSDPEAFADEFPGADPEKRMELRQEAEKRVQNVRSEVNERFASDLRIGVIRADTPEEIALMREDIETAFSGDIINGTTRANLTIALDRKAEDANEAGLALLDVQSAIATGGVASQDSVDLVYDRMAAGEDFQQSDVATRRRVEVGLVRGTGRVPKGMEARITGNLRARDPGVVTEAAEDFMALVNAFPQAQGDFSAGEVSMATAIAPQARLGADPAQVVEEQRKLLRMPPEEQARRADLLQQEQRDQSDLEWLESESEFREIVRPLIIPNIDVDMNDRFVGAFSERVKTYVMLGNDIETARRNAERDARARWAVTRVDNAPRLMEFAPEVAYPEFRGDSDAIREQLIDDTRKLVSDQLRIFDRGGLEAQAENLRIGADFQTIREVDPQTGLPRPGYSVLLQTDSGPEVLLDSDGIPVRFYPDFSLSPEGQRQEEAKTKRIEAARQKDRKHRENQRNNLLKGTNIGDLTGSFLDFDVLERPTMKSGEE